MQKIVDIRRQCASRTENPLYIDVIWASSDDIAALAEFAWTSYGPHGVCVHCMCWLLAWMHDSILVCVADALGSVCSIGVV